MRALKALTSLCSCVDAIEHSVAHNLDKKFKKISCAGTSHWADMFPCYLIRHRATDSNLGVDDFQVFLENLSISIYLYCITPSRRLRAGARQCGVSGRNAFKNKKFP